MLKLYPSVADYLQAQRAAVTPEPQVAGRVAAILSEVQLKGDRAVKRFTERFDGVRVEVLRVPAQAIAEATQRCEPEVKALFQTAIDNVRTFHARQKLGSWFEDTGDGTSFGMQVTPIQNLGVYVPGGTAAYPSTVIMSVVPAQIAGVERIVLASPPDSSGQMNRFVLVAAGLLAVEELYVIGGAQAIAALAFGTESVTAVDKIVGPGNSYVNEAKRQVFGVVGIDALAGPTELVILCDESANPEWVARDLFAQAEHDAETRVSCVTTSEDFAHRLQARVSELLDGTQRREILEAAISNYGAVVVADNLQQAAELVNRIAPEHLQIMTQAPRAVLNKIRNAGAIFLGEHTPAVLGDYCTGPNHILPTGRSARFSSPLSVFDFVKFSSVLQCEPESFKQRAEMAAQFAQLEGLEGHKRSIECRR